MALGVFVSVVALTLANPGVSSAQETAADPMIINADEMIHDQDSGMFTASGHVEIQYRGRTVHAGKVVYDPDDRKLVATSNVRVIDPSGHTMFADHLQLSSDLRDGFIQNVLLLFSDGSRLAAVKADRSGGQRNVLRHAVYSPCELCQENPDKAPLWQIRAETITHNEDEKTIVYKNAVLEFFGIPVGYLPYLSHPDPTVKRKSGFLVPKIGSSSFLGVKLELPYFFNIAPNRDFTLTPLITTRESLSLGGEYRERTKRGRYTLAGSLTRVDERTDANLKTGDRIFRGHVFGDGRFQIGDKTNWGFDAAWTSDDTYLRRYGIADKETLTSRLFIEHFDGRSFASASAYGFQGLRLEDDAGQTPFVLPWLEFHYGSEPGWRGSRYDIDGSLLVMTRPDGADVQRLSFGASWQLPMISRLGTVTRFIARVRGDLYRTHGGSQPRVFLSPFVPGDTGGSGGTEVTGRVAPQVAIDWRMPFVRRGARLSQIIEPVVLVVAGPDTGNPADIPNEDSQSFQFDDTNLFSLDRFTGIDRFDAGSRVSYGLRYSLTGRNGRSAEMLVGQSYRFNRNSVLPRGAGLDRRLSDYVGRLQVNWSNSITYFHRVRLDKDSFAIRLNEADLLLGPKAVKVDIAFLETDNGSVDPFNPDRREIKLGTRFQFTGNWSANGRFVRSLLDDRSVVAEGGLHYQDECIEFGATVRHNFTTDRDLTPSTSVLIRLVLKHLG
ncbi:MAG: LPS-assembly protein LptD [Sphingomonadales bacterium]